MTYPYDTSDEHFRSGIRTYVKLADKYLQYCTTSFFLRLALQAGWRDAVYEMSTYAWFPIRMPDL